MLFVQTQIELLEVTDAGADVRRFIECGGFTPRSSARQNRHEKEQKRGHNRKENTLPVLSAAVAARNGRIGGHQVLLSVSSLVQNWIQDNRFFTEFPISTSIFAQDNMRAALRSQSQVAPAARQVAYALASAGPRGCACWAAQCTAVRATRRQMEPRTEDRIKETERVDSRAPASGRLP
jgi:hypothetical protein